MVAVEPEGALPDRQRELARAQAAIRGCERCVRAGFIPVARPIFRGRVGMRLMVVGQAPAALTHERPLPYAGATGRTLRRWLEEAGFAPGALHACCYLTSLTKCFPGPSRHGKGDRAPSAAEIALCRDHLDRELALVRPRVVLALGRLATTALVGAAPLTELVGTARATERAGHAFLVVPLPHPSGVSRWLNEAENQARVRRALARLAELRVELDLEGVKGNDDAPGSLGARERRGQIPRWVTRDLSLEEGR
jgi:uracil-DNA glycosylase